MARRKCLRKSNRFSSQKEEGNGKDVMESKKPN
jgi:hypothetical protein